MPRIFCIAGARPNFMKIKPVMDAFEKRNADVVLVHAGQHYDYSMNEVFFSELGIRDPDFHLGTGSGSHGNQLARIITAFEPLVLDQRPDAVVVVGDVNSTIACALVAAKAGVVVAHVEAGLRSHDWLMPEEINRVVTDRLSDLLLAPSPDAVQNLRAEGYHEDQIHFVGNVMIDTLNANLGRALKSDVLSRHGLEAGKYALVTIHRPANVDDDAALSTLINTLERISEILPIIMPVHPRTAAQLSGKSISSGIKLIPPAGYLDFVALQAAARMVLTDSGGVQEETTGLGVSCLTLRENTERPITVEQGTNVVVGRDPDTILAAVNDAMTSSPTGRIPDLWDGHSGERIAEVVLDRLARPNMPRPTDIRDLVSARS